MRSPCTQFEKAKGPVPTGFWRVAVGGRRRDDHRVAPGEVGEQRRLRRVEADLEGDVVDRRHLVDAGEQALLGVERALGHRAVEGEDHVLGGEGGAVVEGDAVAQVEDPGEAVGRRLPALGEGGQDGAVGAEAGQPLEDVGVGDLVDRRGGAGGRVEDRRLELHADHDVGALRRGGARHQHQPRRQRQRPPHPSLLQAPRRSASARPITAAASSMSSTPTYSSGWCARSSIPGP